MSDPVAILGELDDLTTRLDKASRELYTLQLDFDQIAANYDDAVNDLLTTLVDKYESEDKRLPGEDVRNALITKQMREQDPILYGNYRRLKSELDRGERRAKRIERQINARQSQLSWLRTEAQAIH